MAKPNNKQASKTTSPTKGTDMSQDENVVDKQVTEGAAQGTTDGAEGAVNSTEGVDINQGSGAISEGTKDSTQDAPDTQTTQEPEPSVQESVSVEVQEPTATDAQKSSLGNLVLNSEHSNTVLSLIERVVATGDSSAIAVVQEFDNFITETGPTRILTTSQFAQAQLAIFRSIQVMINDLTDSQNITLVTVLKMIDETGEYGTLSGAKVFRYGDFSRLSLFEREAYINVWNALHLLAPVKGRKDITKFTDLTILSRSSAFSEVGIRRLVTFAKGEV